jgi:hypothetical protein
MAGVNSQTLAYQYEKVIPRISTLFSRDHTLFDKIEKKNVETISSRAMRVPLDLLAGSKFRQVNADGGDFGRGSAITADYAQLTSVYFAQATEFTKLFEAATDSKEKAVEPAAKRNLEAAIDQMRTGIESLLNTDGSGTLGTITAISGAVVTVANANMFYDNQDVQFFSALGGTNRGTATILSVDANNNTLTFTSNVQSGLSAVVGDLLIVDGAPGTAATSLLGILYSQVDSDSGTWYQLARSSYPGKLKTPHVAANSNALTPQMVRLALAKIQRALGVDTPDIDNLNWHMNLDSSAAWENVGLVVSQVIQNQLGGSESEDMLKKSRPKTMAGRPIIESIHATPNRIDGLCLKHWGRGETQPIGPLEYGGQTMFPIYGASGGLAASTISYLWTGFQVFTSNTRAGAFIDGLPTVSGY